MSQSKLYVGNLSFQTTEEEIRQAFSEYGIVSSVDVVTDRETGRPRGFAFVQMSADAEAQAVLQQMDGQTFGGRNLKVNLANPREARKPNGPRGEFRGGDRTRY